MIEPQSYLGSVLARQKQNINCLFHFAPLHLDPQPPAQLCPGVPARLGVRVHHLPLVLFVLHLEDDDDHHHNDVLLVKYLGGVLEPARQVGTRL